MKTTSKFFSFILILTVLASFFAVPTFADSSDAVAFEFSSESYINGLRYGKTDRILKADAENANSYDVTALYELSGTQTQAQFYLTEQAVAAFSNSNLKYVNILIRNAQEEAQQLYFYVTYNGSAKASVAPGWSVVTIEKKYMLAGSAGETGSYTTGNAFTITGGTSGQKFNIDKIWLSSSQVTSSALSLENATPSNGFNDMSILDAAVSFEFNQNVMVRASSSASFTDENGDSISAVLLANGKVVTAKAASTLLPDTSYTLKVPASTARTSLGIPYSQELTVSFKTSASPLSVGNIKATDLSGEAVMAVPQDGEVMLSANVLNTDEDKAYAIIAATLVSEETGIAQTLISSAEEIPAQMTEASSLTPFSVTVPQGHYLVATVLDSAENLKPLSANYFVLTSQAETSGAVCTGGVMAENVSVRVNEPSLNVDTLTIDGTVSGNAGGVVVVTVREKDSGALKIAVPVVSAPNGSFTYDYVFDGTKSGWYEIGAVAKGAPDADSKPTYYLGDTTKEDIRSAFDSDSVTFDDAAEILAKWRDGMGIPSAYGDDLISHMAITLCEQKPYEQYSDLIEVMNLSVTALNELNDASWSTYAEVTEKYPIILNDDDSLADFEKYGSSGKAEIYKIAVKSSPFANFADFRKAIAKATDAYADKLEKEKEENRRPSTSGGGGGGKISGGSVSVGSSSASQLIQEAEKPVADTISGNAEFADFALDHWAYEAVNELSVRNIIVGYEDGSFRPDRAVTRAEFVKMLVGAFAFAEGNGEKFADVADDAWYKAFLNRASSAGVVKGADGKFNPDAPITRQDAALMLHRSLTHKNAKIDGNANFADEHMLSDYASEAVKALAGSGLISGYEDGSFAPKNEITRAETAKLIYSAISYLTGGVAK